MPGLSIAAASTSQTMTRTAAATSQAPSNAPARQRMRIARGASSGSTSPASLMPARQFLCWAGEGGGRERCEEIDPRAQAMIFDLHNLAPSIGQVNALRGDDRYAD